MEASPSPQVATKPLQDGDTFSPILLLLSLPYLALLPGRQYSKVVYVDTPLLTALREGDTLAWAGWGPQQLSRGHGTLACRELTDTTEGIFPAELAGDNAQEEEEGGQGPWGLKSWGGES